MPLSSTTLTIPARALAATCALLIPLGLAGCGSSSQEAAPAASAAVPADLLSANTATAAELQTIPGVGEEIADEIIEYRPYDAETGPDRFRQEMAKYIDEAEIERIMAYLDFAG